ncbi:MAG: DUF1579 domain-containing protein [Acidobacteria bacterium]|nr:MAG: DUF1579 domain-containing protein [Acidobacteriota bacterium]
MIERKTTLVLTLLLAALPAAATTERQAGGMTAEEVIEKHVAARGGREAWAKIRSLKITGDFTAFSKVSPFTLHRKRAGDAVLYHLDHKLGDKLVVVGYDGETYWWDNRWFQEGAQAIKGADLAVVERDAEMTTPFFDYREKGHKVKLAGAVTIDGLETLALELERADGSRETWYLDPETYLEVARDSPASDFGRPAEQRTYYDDFRRVGEVVMPFFVESQWYTRDRVMAIAEVEINPEIDDELFRMPLPIGMGPLRALAGTFEVAVASRQQPGAPLEESQRRSTIVSLLGGGLLEERYATADGNQVVRTLSYDRYRKRYQLTQINDATTLLDVQRGDFDDQGRLVLTNLDTGTPLEMFGLTIHERCSIQDVTEQGFTLIRELSIDGGESWFEAEKSVYARSDDGG